MLVMIIIVVIVGNRFDRGFTQNLELNNEANTVGMHRNISKTNTHTHTRINGIFECRWGGGTVQSFYCVFDREEIYFYKCSPSYKNCITLANDLL